MIKNMDIEGRNQSSSTSKNVYIFQIMQILAIKTPHRPERCLAFFSFIWFEYNIIQQMIK